MRKLAILITLLIANTAPAPTVITYNIPDVYGLKLLEALEAQSDSNVVIRITKVDKSGGEPRVTYFADISFDLPERDPALSNGDFVKRRMARFADALRLAHEKKLLQDIRKTYLAGTPSVNVNDPDPNEMN
jgi:hypothetical protein